ncbi:adenine phosphoribosyltransferase [uncultured Microbacterium sp.]|uniref:adenine phosphoribosyltransferase n=1 Tax=uncultured Microbacterium sp. TaxID=191216 RepID=UPI0025DC2337|nr:adenine phosphoribosyltransferase [uncultured Microbacterium sp.]
MPDLDASTATETDSAARAAAPVGASATDPTGLERAESLIAVIPDYPSPGILFRDITPMLADGDAFRAAIDAVIAPFAGTFDVVAGIEARGFIVASAAAIAAGCGVVPIRKAGKLPRPAASVDYALEYATATIEIHDDIAPGTRVLLLDDVLATGGTIAAARTLVHEIGAEVTGVGVLIELEALGGRAVAGDVHSLWTV